MRLEYFELIDSVDAFDPVKGRIEVTAEIPLHSTIFEGHFPTYPVMPGVLLLETMNQASGWLMLGLNEWGRLPYFVGTKRTKIKRFVSPGQTLKVSANLVHEGSGFCMTEGMVKVDGETAAEAEITMMVMDFPTPELAAEVKRRAEAIGAKLIAGAK